MIYHQVAKACEPLGLAAHLKVKLESGVSNQRAVNQVQVILKEL